MHFSAFTHIYRIVLAYIIFGTLWIVLSDVVVDYLANHWFFFHHPQTVKGVAFILVTAFLLYYLLLQDFRNIQSVWQKLSESEKRYRTAFNNTPHPLWEVDLSRLKAYVDAHPQVSPQALPEQLTHAPDLLEQCFSRIVVTDISDSVRSLFGADYGNKETPPCAKLFEDREH